MKTMRHSRFLLAVVLSISLLFGTILSANAAEVEGKTVTGISVTGNTTVPESSITSAIKLKPGDTLTADKVKQDMQSIYELGYFFDVVTNFTEVPEGVKVTYTVMENPVLNSITFKGNTKVSTEKLTSMLTVTKGQILNSKNLNENMRAIEQYYHDQGYILAKVSDINMGSGGALTVTVNEGVLEGIIIKGNEKTKNYVITREMKLKTGEAFNANDARRSMQKVYNLGYFEDVNMKLNPGKEPNAIVLETSVVEQKTGVFTIGGGYSKSDGMVGIIELGDNNFRGTGDKAKIHWEFGGDAGDRNYELSYTKPWIDEKQTSASISIYNYQNEYTDYYNGGDEKADYDKRRRGWELTLGRAQDDYTNNYITLKNRKDEFVEYNSGPEDYSKDPEYLKDNFGLTRSVTLMRVFDSRDNVFSPTEGKRYSLSAEFAGRMFGGDFNYNKYTSESRFYKKAGEDKVWAFKLSAGFANGSMPEAGEFSIGGADTLRGYDDDEYKGNKMIAATVEYRFPVVKKVQGVVFTDLGDAWGGKDDNSSFSLKKSVGVGLRITTPIGPIKLDYGKGTEGGKMHFSFGGQF